ncbi:MAG: hypothetical protein FWF36_02020 [Propionibacteriaceae bacterium]|nr:hypothetical protein [Propionibacteriaceae bacterium]
MTDILWVNERYRIAKDMLESTIEIWPVGDHLGHVFDQRLRGLLVVSQDSLEVFGDLIGAAKALRWRLLTDPQPWVCGDDYVLSAARAVGVEAGKLHAAISPEAQQALTDLAEAAQRLAQENPSVGSVLLQAADEVGPRDCLVVAANNASAERLARWLHPNGVGVLTARELIHFPREVEQVYAVGPPRLFASAIVTAPVSSSMAFLFPEWFSDRTLPVSPLSKYSQGTFGVETHVFPVNQSPAVDESAQAPPEDMMLPTPVWPVKANPDRIPRPLEALARRAYLSGGYFVFLDEGERVRTIEPTQAIEERVVSLPINAVQPGVYLLLRLGESEQGSLYAAAINSFGARAVEIANSQAKWKKALGERVGQYGVEGCETELRGLGVKAAGRVLAWIDPTLDRPQRNSDFRLLLKWLDIDEQPAFTLATDLRRKRQQLGHSVRSELEKVLSTSDLTSLMVKGHLALSSADPKYRGMIATRVLAISPWQEIVAVQQTRVLFEDHRGGGRWLE